MDLRLAVPRPSVESATSSVENHFRDRRRPVPVRLDQLIPLPKLSRLRNARLEFPANRQANRKRRRPSSCFADYVKYFQFPRTRVVHTYTHRGRERMPRVSFRAYLPTFFSRAREDGFPDRRIRHRTLYRTARKRGMLRVPLYAISRGLLHAENWRVPSRDVIVSANSWVLRPFKLTMTIRQSIGINHEGIYALSLRRYPQ